MIHKFILGRCVQCNIPLEDLESVGWECRGHTKKEGGTSNLASALKDAPCLSPTEGSDCPKCAATIKPTALVCPHCSFDIVGYRENLREAKYTEMIPLPITAKAKERALADVYSSGSGCAALLMLIISGIVWVIPVVGWFAAPVFFIMGIIGLISPVRGSKWMDSTFSPEEYQRNENEALQLLQNSFQDAECPNCHHLKEDVSWPTAGGWLDCPQCTKRLLRQQNRLYYIPNPDALLSDDLKAFPSLPVGMGDHQPATCEPQESQSPENKEAASTNTIEEGVKMLLIGGAILFTITLFYLWLKDQL